MKKEVLRQSEFAGTVADEIVSAIGEVLTERERCSLCLSGGTTPGAVYRLLRIPPRVDDIEWGRLDLFWGDERFVPADDNRSNQHMVRDTLLHHLPPGQQPAVYPVCTEEASAEEAARAYETVLSDYGLSPEGEKVFDIVLLGIGEDGHTASLFPGQSRCFGGSSSGRLVIAAPHPTDGTDRISLTPAPLFSARRIYFLVSGEKKAEMVSRIFNERELSPDEVPAVHAREASGEVVWFLDRAAAGTL
ncbi:6-phosphogluconolactonase [bacterium]|nr:6-phosphogluconolactonase [bacterium]